MADTTTDKRRILEMVAAGSVSPAEAAELLQAVERSEPSTTDLPVDRIMILGTFRSLLVEGDPQVQTAIADGQHRVRHEGGTLIFEEDPDEQDGFILFGPDKRRKGVSIRVNDRRFTLGEHGGPARPQALRIRMNPSLALELSLTAGTARIAGISAPIKANISAGTARLDGVTQPFEVNVDAGSVSAACRLEEGDSKVRCTAGRIKIELDPDSDVSVVARSTLGKLQVPSNEGGDEPWTGIGGGKREMTLGGGRARLDLEATTGAVVVEVGR